MPRKIKTWSVFDETFDNFTKKMSIFSQSNRLQILHLFRKSKELELPVWQIFQALNLRQNLVSHHLKVMKELWIMKSRGAGKQRFYSVDSDKLYDFIIDITNHI